MAELQRDVSLAEFAGWLLYFAEEKRAADPNAPIDLTDASPEQIRALFGVR